MEDLIRVLFGEGTDLTVWQMAARTVVTRSAADTPVSSFQPPSSSALIGLLIAIEVTLGLAIAMIAPLRITTKSDIAEYQVDSNVFDKEFDLVAHCLSVECMQKRMSGTVGNGTRTVRRPCTPSA